MIRARPLTIKCPNCGSDKVAYSCEPECCFNHVCEDCLASFQLATRSLGETITGLPAMLEEKDSCAPTARCAKCQSLEVHSIDMDDAEGPSAFCVACGAALELVCQ